MTPPLLIKICGLTRVSDAIAAVDAGADLLGLNFHRPSPRYVAPATARRIVDATAGGAAAVGVFVDASLSEIEEVLAVCPLRYLQLHGSETPELCRALPLPAIKAHRLRTSEDLRRIPLYRTSETLLFVADAWHPSLAGGTGCRLELSLARAAALLGSMLLAGGLTPGNVGDAVRAVRPFGVDVASGVEAAPGLKDTAMMRDFVAAARHAAAEPM